METPMENQLVTIPGEVSRRTYRSEISVIEAADEKITEIEKLEREYDGLSEQLSTLNKEIEEFEVEVGACSPELFEEFRTLRAELVKLMQKKEEEKDVAELKLRHSNESKVEQVQRAAEEARKHNEKLQEKTKKMHRGKVNKDARTLYKKIVALTHPDKTSNTEFHNLFLLAQKAYEQCDIDTLEEIWKEVSGKRSAQWILRMMDRMDALREDVKEKREKLEELKHSDAFKMKEDFKNPSTKAHVILHHRRLLRIRVDRIRETIYTLDPTRRPEPILSTAQGTTGASFSSALRGFFK